MDELLECEQQYKKQRETGISDGMIAGIVSRSHWATSSVRNEDIHFDIRQALPHCHLLLKLRGCISTASGSECVNDTGEWRVEDAHASDE